MAAPTSLEIVSGAASITVRVVGDVDTASRTSSRRPANGGSLVVADPPEMVRRLFELTKVDEVLTILS